MVLHYCTWKRTESYSFIALHFAGEVRREGSISYIFITEVAGSRSHTRLQTRGPSLPQLHVLVALRVGNTDSRGLEMHLNMQWMN